jgi:hypothetical protein
MRKLLGVTLALASLGFGGLSSGAKASESSANSATVLATGQNLQWERDRGGRRANRRVVRTRTQSRVVRIGRRLYRETYLVSYLPNGRTNTRLVSRVRIS